MLREEIAVGSELGKRIDLSLRQGLLLSDEDLLQVIRARIDHLPEHKGIIFDGVPRTIRQAEELMAILQADDYGNFITIFVDVPRDVATVRLLKRAEIEHRPDDTPEVIAVRLKQYEDQTLPVLHYLKQQTRLIDIDGTPSIEAIEKNIAREFQLS